MEKDSFLSKLAALGEMEIDLAALLSFKPGGFFFWLIDLIADIFRSIIFVALGMSVIIAPMFIATDYITAMSMEWKMIMIVVSSVAMVPLVMSSNLIFWSCLGEDKLHSIWKEDVSILDYNLREAYKKLGFFRVQTKIWASAFYYFFWTLFRLAIVAAAIFIIIFLYQSFMTPIV
jgi:hypothetical protein